MLLVPCPHCGPRNAADLRYVGEARTRPDPATATPAEWRAYLYIEKNPAGWLRENWYCRFGCRRYFTVERNTETNEFRNPPIPGAKFGGRA
jgi:heterotetrameric sarcosine oxidase delta subunit